MRTWNNPTRPHPQRHPLIRMLPAVSLAIALGAPATGHAQSRPAEPTDDAAALVAASATITASDMYSRIAFLASDELRGRDTPSPGLERAAVYIAQQFREFGLEPAGDSGSYIQRYPYVRHGIDTALTTLSAIGPEGVTALAYGTDFFIIPAVADSVAGTPVFAGSVADVQDGFPPEVKGRIAVLEAPANLRGGILRLPEAAAAAGATALILVLNPVVTEPLVSAVAGQLAGMGVEVPIPTFGVRRQPSETLFRAEGAELGILLRRPEGGAGRVASHTALRMVPGVTRTESQVPNVVAMLRGSDPALRDEYVVLSAHFDHVGVGRPDAEGDSIYNGADDDASGTSAVIEAAQAFASLPTPPRRSILFLTVSGEEKGLLGSRYFGEHPTVPLEGVVADINMDMVGRNAPDTLVALGQEYTTLGPLAHQIAEGTPDIGFHIIADPDPSENAFFRSDHIVFVRNKIPTIFFTAWLHEDYHQPSDEVEKIDVEKAARVGRLVFRLADRVAEAPEPPAWVEGGWDKVQEILRAGRR